MPFDRIKFFILIHRTEAAILTTFSLLWILFLGGSFFFLRERSKAQLINPLGIATSQQSTESSEILGTQKESPTPSAEVVKPQEIKKPAPQKKASPPAQGTSNNKFGMYINADPAQVAEVAPLLNSNGGDWGWVLIPFPFNERNRDFWHDILSSCADHHLKPLIQLFNTTCNPDEMDFQGLAEFFNELPWPTKHLYISVFNEVNAVYYWCERKSPEEYALALNRAIDAFKSVNPNFFVMPSGFNSSARSGPRYMDEEEYLLRMNAAVPGIFAKLDGWATHAYPHPEFSGDFYNPPSWYGVRDQVENYKWEMGLLKKHFGVTGLPIFITETGWAHKEGWLPKWQYKAASVTARYFDDAYRSHWLPDNQIVAIMPFVWYKEDAPNFNWKREDGTFYPQYDVVMGFPKVKGTND